MPKIWVKQYGVLLAFAILVVESLFAMQKLGLAAGVFVVASAWMVSGSFFIAAVNAWPAKSMRVAMICGGLGFVIAVLVFLI